MSWASLGSNHAFSGNDLLDAVANSVFTVKAGQTIPATNECLTRAETYALVDIQTIAGTSNELAVKSELVATAGLYNFGLSYDASSGNEAAWNYEACGQINVYSPTNYPTVPFATDDFLYSDSAGTTFVAAGHWSDGVKDYTVDTGGQITAITSVSDPVSQKTLKGKFGTTHFSTDITSGYSYGDSRLDESDFFAVKSFEGWVIGSKIYNDDGCWVEWTGDGVNHYFIDSDNIVYVTDQNFTITDIVLPLTNSCFMILISYNAGGNIFMDVELQNSSSVNQTISCTVTGNTTSNVEVVSAVVLAGNTTAQGNSTSGGFDDETYTIDNEAISPGEDSTYRYVFC